MLSLHYFKSGSDWKSHNLKFYPLQLNYRCSTLYCTGTLPTNTTITFWPTAYKNSSLIHKITYSLHCVSEMYGQYFKLLHRNLQFQDMPLI